MTFSSENPARVLIIDDHALVRYGMGVLLSGANDLSLCGEGKDFDTGLTAIHQLKPDVAVIDIILQERSGLDLIRQLRKEGQTLPIVVMSMHHESTHAEKALRAGAQGYIMKEDADEVLIDALHTVLQGKLHVSNKINEKLLRTYIEDDGEENHNHIDCLTNREKEIFKCLGQGMTTKKMAEQFGLSPRTVEVHRARIKKKLECENAAELLRTAVQWFELQTNDF